MSASAVTNLAVASGGVPDTCDPASGGSRYLELQVSLAMTELCSAMWSALDNERDTAESSLRRAIEILKRMRIGPAPMPEHSAGGLAPWQIRKVTGYIDAHLDQPIRNDDLAELARLHPSHFGRAFRESLGETPHEYVIRRRIEHAQGLMLSTRAPLAEIALNCGLADQAHLTRLFRRIAGESPSAWRRARIGAPADDCHHRSRTPSACAV